VRPTRLRVLRQVEAGLRLAVEAGLRLAVAAGLRLAVAAGLRLAVAAAGLEAMAPTAPPHIGGHAKEAQGRRGAGGVKQSNRCCASLAMVA